MKVKVELHPKVKLVVDVNKKMKDDFLECKDMAMKENGKDCSKCSWNELCIDSTGICEFIGVEDLEK
jgi:CRISPR/Cas system-associated exonuclease Cas4 (RecB family)